MDEQEERFKENGLPIERLTAEQVHEKVPYICDNVIVANFSPMSGYSNPLKAGMAILMKARKMGCSFCNHQFIRRVEPAEDGGHIAYSDDEQYHAQKIVISGGIRRIAKTAELIVPFMTIGFVILTIVIIVMKASQLPTAFSLIISSAFGVNAVFGGMMGTAVLWGVKRSVNSSGAGMGEAVPAASATECAHPGVQGLVNPFSVYIDVFVCICTAFIIILTDCFNVQDTAGNLLYTSAGSTAVATQVVEPGISWAQEALNSLFPSGIGATVLAFFLFFFAFTTLLNYYYQGETAIAYMLIKQSKKTRTQAIWALRIVMPLIFFYFAIQTSATSFSTGELGVGLMVWFNVMILLIMAPTVKKVHEDYAAQRKAGIEAPVFNPQKLGIKNADLWMEINKDKI